MSDRDWPHWPEDQIPMPLPEMEEPKQDARDSKESLTRGGRVKEKDKNIKERGRTLCPKCGWPKTIGLPCTVCSRWSEK